MNIKERIGNRITKSRKELGITIKELATRTESLSAARISNWEQGTRSPGPIEAKLVASVLGVAASYLLCLTDNPHGELSLSTNNTCRFIPILNEQEVVNAKKLLNSTELLNTNMEHTILIDKNNSATNKENLFATYVKDASMENFFNINDLVIIDANKLPLPGDYVLAYLPTKKQSILRKYSEAAGCLFQLLANNPLWAPIQTQSDEDAMIIGVVVEYRRYF